MFWYHHFCGAQAQILCRHIRLVRQFVAHVVALSAARWAGEELGAWIGGHKHNRLFVNLTSAIVWINVGVDGIIFPQISSVSEVYPSFMHA